MPRTLGLVQTIDRYLNFFLTICNLKKLKTRRIYLAAGFSIRFLTWGGFVHPIGEEALQWGRGPDDW